MREASYSTIRIGAYEPMKELLGAHNPARTPLWKKIVAGASSGAIGSAMASPTDLVKIRLQADANLKPGECSTMYIQCPNCKCKNSFCESKIHFANDAL